VALPDISYFINLLFVLMFVSPIAFTADKVPRLRRPVPQPGTYLLEIYPARLLSAIAVADRDGGLNRRFPL
jgi:hypothetical protein